MRTFNIWKRYCSTAIWLASFQEKSAVTLLWVVSLFPLLLRFALSLVLSDLIMMCLGVIFFMFLMLVVHWALRTCGFIVFIKFRKMSFKYLSSSFLHISYTIILFFKRLLEYFNSHVLIHYVIIISQSILQIKCMTIYEIFNGRTKLNIGQENEFFQHQVPKEDMLPAEPKEESGNATGTASACAPCVRSLCLPQVGLFFFFVFHFGSFVWLCLQVH